MTILPPSMNVSNSVLVSSTEKETALLTAEDRRLSKNKRSREDYQKNKQKRLAQIAEYRKNNPEKLKNWKRIWHKNNPEKISEYHRRYAKKHPEVIAEVNSRFVKNHPNYQSDWHAARKTERNAKTKEWHKNNRGLSTSYTTSYKRLKDQAMPPWVDRRDIDTIYIQSAQKTVETGIRHEVDHIWPIKGKGFTGLHVPWNLRVITHEENRKKRCRRPQPHEYQSAVGMSLV